MDRKFNVYWSQGGWTKAALYRSESFFIFIERLYYCLL